MDEGFRYLALGCDGSRHGSLNYDMDAEALKVAIRIIKCCLTETIKVLNDNRERLVVHIITELLEKNRLTPEDLEVILGAPGNHVGGSQLAIQTAVSSLSLSTGQQYDVILVTCQSIVWEV